MAIDAHADSVRQQIAAAYGETSDLSEELVNTLCNLHYFAEKAQKQDFGGLSDLQELKPFKGKAELVTMHADHMKHVAFAASRAPELIQKLRAVRHENRAAFPYFEEVTLDLLKYRIADAENKSGLRRMVERKWKSPNEHKDLARKFKVAFRGAARAQEPNESRQFESIHEPTENQRQDVMREPIAPLAVVGEDCDQLVNGTGRFGQGRNPVPVNGLLGTYKYLAKLHTATTGVIVYFHRIGSLSIDLSLHPVDVYELVARDASSWDFIFVDMYHPRRSNRAPDGYVLKPYDQQIGDIPLAYGVDVYCPRFPYDLGDAIEQRNGLPAFARRVREQVVRGGYERPKQHESRFLNIRSHVSAIRSL